MKEAERQRAIELRKQGISYFHILKEISVSKSTLSLWLRDIELTPEQKEKLLRGRQIAGYAGAKARQRERIENTKNILAKSRKEFLPLAKDPLFLIGLSLYWAEGAKNREESIKFANSDESMIKLMMIWFRKICKVDEKKFRLGLHIHSLLSNTEAREYWSRVTKIPLTQIHKTYIKPTSLGHRKNALYNGTCTICISDKNLFRRIAGWRLGLLDLFSIEPTTQGTMLTAWSNSINPIK